MMAVLLSGACSMQATDASLVPATAASSVPVTQTRQEGSDVQHSVIPCSSHSYNSNCPVAATVTTATAVPCYADRSDSPPSLLFSMHDH